MERERRPNARVCPTPCALRSPGCSSLPPSLSPRCHLPPFHPSHRTPPHAPPYPLFLPPLPHPRRLHSNRRTSRPLSNDGSPHSTARPASPAHNSPVLDPFATHAHAPNRRPHSPLIPNVPLTVHPAALHTKLRTHSTGGDRARLSTRRMWIDIHAISHVAPLCQRSTCIQTIGLELGNALSQCVFVGDISCVAFAVTLPRLISPPSCHETGTPPWTVSMHCARQRDYRRGRSSRSRRTTRPPRGASRCIAHPVSPGPKKAHTRTHRKPPTNVARGQSYECNRACAGSWI